MAKHEFAPTVSAGPSGTTTSAPRVSPVAISINQLLRIQPSNNKLAAEKALMAFLQPPRMSLNSHQRSLLDTATKTTIQVDGKAIANYSWSSVERETGATNALEPSTVLLSHGYGTGAAAMLNFVQPLLDAGFRVVACDHTGHGASEGDWGDTLIFTHAIQALARRHAPLAAIVGHSVGASMALVALADSPQLAFACPRLVCLNPPTHTDAVLRRFLQGIGCPQDLSPMMEQLMEDRGVLSPGRVRQVELSSEMQRRILFVLDRGDRMVDATDVEYIAKAFGNSRLEMTEGYGHFGSLKSPEVVRLVTGFVVEGTRPSKL